jgi:hypothetical protein
VSWVNKGSGYWDVPSNWSSGQVPQPGQDVTIDVSASITVTYRTGTTTVNSLHSKESLVISGGLLSITNPSDVAGNLTLSNGTLDGSGDIQVSGLLTWSGGSMTGSGHTQATGGLAITGGSSKTLNGRALDNLGTATWSGTGNIASGNGSVLTNAAGATLTIQNNQSLQFSLGGAIPTLNNAGTLIKSTGTGTTTLQALLVNTGGVDVQNGILTLEGATSSSALVAEAGATLRFARMSSQPVTGSYTMDANSAVGGAGTLDVNGGTATIAGTYAVANTTITGGSLIVNAPITIPVLSLSSGTLDGSASVAVTGPLTWSGGTMTGSGHTVAQGGLSIQGNGSKTLNGRALDNAGAATWTGTGNISSGNGAVVTNQTTATFTLQNDQNLSFGVGGAAATFINAGALVKNGTTGTTTVAIALINSGSLEVDSGTLKLSKSYVQTAGQTLLKGGGLAGAGTSSVFSLQGGHLSGAGSIAASVNNAAQVDVGGSSAEGLLSIGGTYTQTATGVLNVEVGGASNCPAADQLAVAGKATLAGTLAISLTDGCHPSTGQPFTILTFGSRAADFTNVTGLATHFTRSTGTTSTTLAGI